MEIAGLNPAPPPAQPENPDVAAPSDPPSPAAPSQPAPFQPAPAPFQPSGFDPNGPQPAPQQRLPPFNPQLLPPETKAAYDKVVGDDHKVRDAGLADLKKAAATGDFTAIEALSNLAGDPLRTRHLDKGTAQTVRAEAAKGLRDASGLLRPTDVKHLLNALDNQSVVGREAATTLGIVASGQGPVAREAADGLRARVYDNTPRPTREEQIPGGPPANRRAADGLAKLYNTPAFRPDDYRTLLQGAGFGDGNVARQTLTDAAKAGDPDAIADLRAALRGQGGADDDSRDLAARILSDAGRLGPEDLRALEKTAAAGGSLAVDALQKMATGDQPSAAAMDALARLAQGPSPAAGKAGSAFQDAYASAGAEQRSKYALQLLGMDTARPEQLKDAIQLAGARAAKGDAEAVKALEARYGSEGPRGFGPSIAGQLRDAAVKGNDGAAEALARLSQGTGTKAEVATTALGGAAVGGSQKATEALASLAASDKAEERARALPALGDVAVAAKPGSKQLETSLEGLRGALGRPADALAAARELGRAADKLGPKDTDALLKAVDPANQDAAVEALHALAKASATQPGLANKVRGTIAEKAKDLPGLDADTVAKLVGTDTKTPESRAALAKLVEESGDPAVRRMASTALSKPGVFEQLDEKTKTMVAEAVGYSGDAEAAKSLLARNPQWANGPMGDAKLEQIAQQYTDLLTKKIQQADPNSPLGKFGRLFAARHLAYDIHNPDPKKQKLAWNVNLPNVEADLRQLVQSKPFLDACEGVRQEVLKKHQDLGPAQEKYLLGEDFQRRLALTPEKERPLLLTKEIAALASVDPAAAERVKTELTAREAENNLGELARQALNKPGGAELMASVMDEATAGKMGTKFWKNAVKGYALLPKGIKGPAMIATLARNAQAEIRQIETAVSLGQMSAEAGKEAKSFQEKFKELLKAPEKTRGAISTFATCASLFALGVDTAENGLPKGVKDIRTWSAVKDFASALGSADSMVKAYWGAKGTPAETFLGKAVKGARILGPIADAGGAVIDGVKAYKAYTEADVGRTIGNGVSALGGLATAGAGVAILAGASGPAAPVVLVAGTAALVGGALINHYLGDTADEKFLKEMGRMYSPDDYKGDKNDRYIYPYMGGDSVRRRVTVGKGEMPPLMP